MAAVRINQYDEQISTPSGGVDVSQRPMVVQQQGPDLSGFAAGFRELAEQKEKSDLNNARAELSALEPEAQLAFQTEYNRIESTWAPGQSPIAQQMRDYINAYTAKVEGTLKSPKAAALVRDRSNELSTAYMLRGGAKQLQIERDVRIGQYSKAYEDNSALGATNPDGVGLALAKLNSIVMADDQIPLTQRQEIVKNGANAVGMAVAKVQAEANPAKVMSVVGGILGLTQPTLAVPQGDLVAAITKRESGNRLYDEAGKILRGPAIKQQNGSIVHAYGKYQMLESTAKAEASKLGIAWDRELFMRERTGNAQKDQETADYHDKLGQSHIADNLSRFGNPIVAAAAHNMGPAAAEGWAAGRPYQTQSGKWWHPTKPMDMAAMPAETREYVKGIGDVKEVPVATPADVSSEYATAFRLLTPEQQLSVYGSAQSRAAEMMRAQKQQQEVSKGFFKQELDNLTAAAKAGDDFTMPSDEQFALLGPVDAVLEKQRLAGLKVMAGQLNSQKSMSNAELQAMELMPDPEGTDDRANRQAQVQALRANAKAIVAQREADPGLAASQNAQVQAAAAAWQSAAAAVYSKDNPTSPPGPAEFEAMNKAQGDYVTASFAVQRQWGVLNPKLPKAMADNIGDGFNRMLKDGNTMAAAARMQAFQKQVGGNYDAIEQVAKQTGDVGRFAMEGVPPGVLNTLYQSKQIKPADLDQQMGAVKPADLKQQVSNAFAPLLVSLNAAGPDGAGDSAAAARYMAGGELLAKTYLANGKASSPKEAAQMAYTDLYANRETVTKAGLRIPNSYQPDAVSNGLARHVATLKPTDLAIPTVVGFTEEETASRQLRAVRANGRWVTDETGDGAYLMVGGKPVMGANNKPVQITYSQAVAVPQMGQIEAPYVPSVQGLR